MTDAEWRKGEHPSPLIAALEGHVTGRKMQLLARGWLRHWPRPLHGWVHEVWDAIETIADGAIASPSITTIVPSDFANRAEWINVFSSPGPALVKWVEDIYVSRMDPASPDWVVVLREWANCVRCVFGELPPRKAGWLRLFSKGVLEAFAGAADRRILPEQSFLRSSYPPESIDPWLTSTVTQLATGIYEHRAFDRMPILADALMDAGCDNPDVLGHCRSSGPHVRGCWVVDLLLGKE